MALYKLDYSVIIAINISAHATDHHVRLFFSMWRRILTTRMRSFDSVVIVVVLLQYIAL